MSITHEVENMTTMILRLPDVIARTGLCRSSIYALASKGGFPPPIRLGERSVGWLSSEVERWIDDRLQLRGTAPLKGGAR
jgi:prophage regulatory protein